MLEELSNISEVEAVSPNIWLGAYHKERKNGISAYGVHPSDYLRMFNLEMDIETRDCFIGTRNGAIATNTVPEFQSTVPGSHIPLLSNVIQNKDGAMEWPMHYCGQFRVPEADEQPQELLFNYKYIEEGSLNGFPLTRIVVLASSGTRDLAQRIDAAHKHSPNPTRSMPLDEYSRLGARRIADVASIAAVLILAIFVSILFVVRAMYAQSLRERASELSTLNALGYSRWLLSFGVVFEFSAIMLSGCLLGLAMSITTLPLVKEPLQFLTGNFEMTWRTAVESALLSMAMGSILGATLLASIRLQGKNV